MQTVENELAQLYFAHPEMVLIPVEAIGAKGLDAAYARALREARTLSEAWIDVFSLSVRTYFERVAALFGRAPASWFPPRCQNVFVVFDAENTRPYYQPFEGSSWMVYASDFDPALSNLEYAVYQLVHAERLAAERQMGRAMALNLGWWLERDADEREAFAQAAHRATRPDAPAFVALARALPWVADLYHAQLRPPDRQFNEPYASIKALHLYVPKSRADELRGLVRTFDEVGSSVAKGYLEVQASTRPDADALEALCRWLVCERPPVRVLGHDEAVLWDPKGPDVSQLRRALSGVGTSAVSSLLADLRVVSARTRSFFQAARHPERLPDHVHDVAPEGGTYVDPRARVMVYSLVQPGIDTSVEPAPPYHRLLLGARTMHEWGHLAADAGWIGIPGDARFDHVAACAELGAAYERLLEGASSPFQEAAAEELRELGIVAQRCGPALKDLTLARISDYLANLLMRALAPIAETEAYIRANVKTHVHEPLGPMQQIVRYTYEYQYLLLSRMSDPLDYFMQSTWFSDYFIESGLVRRADFVELLDTCARAFALHRIDPAFFDLPCSAVMVE